MVMEEVVELDLEGIAGEGHEHSPDGVFSVERAGIPHIELWEAYRDNGDMGARAQLVDNYMPLVKPIALKYVGEFERLDDLLQIGAVGLIKAVDRYNLSKGVNFANLAIPYIEGKILNHLRDHGSPLKVPRLLRINSINLNNLAGKLVAELGHWPSNEELSEISGLDPGKIGEVLLYNRGRFPKYLYEELDPDSEGGHTLIDILELHNGDLDPDFGSTLDELNVVSFLSMLSPKEMYVLERKLYGGLSQREIAKTMEYSQMHVSRLQRHALGKLRNVLGLQENGYGEGVREPSRNGLTGEQIFQVIRDYTIYDGNELRASEHGDYSLPTYIKYWREAGLKNPPRGGNQNGGSVGSLETQTLIPLTNSRLPYSEDRGLNILIYALHRGEPIISEEAIIQAGYELNQGRYNVDRELNHRMYNNLAAIMHKLINFGLMERLNGSNRHGVSQLTEKGRALTLENLTIDNAEFLGIKLTEKEKISLSQRTETINVDTAIEYTGNTPPSMRDVFERKRVSQNGNPRTATERFTIYAGK